MRLPWDKEHPIVSGAPVDPTPPPDEGDAGVPEVEGQGEEQ
jgi:hypothetical protein